MMPHPYHDTQAVGLDKLGRDEPLPLRAQVLRKAESLVCGVRNGEYGSPYDSHQRIAALWSALLGIEVRPYQAALMLALMKASRAMTDTKQDTFDDGSAYFALAFEILEEEKLS